MTPAASSTVRSSPGGPALNSRLERPGFDHRTVPSLPDRRAQVPGAVRGIAVPLTHRAAAGGLAGHELGSHRGVAVFFPGRLGELLAGDDSGLGIGHDVGAVTIPAILRRLAGYAAPAGHSPR